MISTSWYIISCNFGGRIMNGFDRSYFIEGGSETPLARSREAKNNNKKKTKKKANRSGYRQLNAIRFKK